MSMKDLLEFLNSDVPEYALRVAKKEARRIHPKLASKLEATTKTQIATETDKDGQPHLVLKYVLQITFPERPWIFYIWGTKPHWICARLWRQCGKPDPLWKHAAWNLKLKIGGKTIFRKRVWHKGIKGKKDVFLNAREKAKNEVMKWLERKLEKFLL